MTPRATAPLARWTAPLESQLPDAEETLLLRACLHEGSAAGAAWEAWTHQRGWAGGGDPRSSLAAYNVLLPLLGWNLRRNGIRVRGAAGACLGGAGLTEELRWNRYAAICTSALLALHAADVPVIVLKGAALAQSVYPAPPLRHAADLDLLLRGCDLGRAVECLSDQGWRRGRAPVPNSTTHLPPLFHASSLPLELHHRLLIPYYTLPYDAVWARSEPAAVAGVPTRVLSAPDALLHVCAHGVLGGRMLHWVADAWFLLQRPLDWHSFTSTAIAARLGLPLSVAMGFLSRSLEAPVPPAVLDELRAAAARTDVRGRSAARPWPRGSARQIWQGNGSVMQRAARLGRRAFPHPLAYALRYDLPLWKVPLSYASRLIWFARGRARVAEL